MNVKTHTACRRCGKVSFHKQKKSCAACGYPEAKIRKCKCYTSFSCTNCAVFCLIYLWVMCFVGSRLVRESEPSTNDWNWKNEVPKDSSKTFQEWFPGRYGHAFINIYDVVVLVFCCSVFVLTSSPMVNLINVEPFLFQAPKLSQ